MKHIIIAGGTGFVGAALATMLMDKGYHVTILTRTPGKYQPFKNCNYKYWNVEENKMDADIFEQADAVVNLAGVNIAQKRWTANRKKEITNSRVNAGKFLVQTILHTKNNIKVFINASAIGWYGADANNHEHRSFTETDKNSDDFLGNSCYLWEQSVASIKDAGIRLVVVRTGIVLNPAGGALKEFLKPIRWGVAPILGSGKQMMSWVQLYDLVSIYLAAIEQDSYEGVYNAVAPNPCSYKHFIILLAKKIKGKYYTTIPIPNFILKLVLGEMSIEVLKSTTVSANKISNTGFVFQFPTIESVIKDIFQKGA